MRGERRRGGDIGSTNLGGKLPRVSTVTYLAIESLTFFSRQYEDPTVVRCFPQRRSFSGFRLMTS